MTVVRPYDVGFRQHVMKHLNALGYVANAICPAKTNNDEVMAFLAALETLPDLLLLPFHEHTCSAGTGVDGLEVAALLPERWIQKEVPILMPLSDFAFASSFPRRFHAFQIAHPKTAALLIPLPPAEIHAEALRARLEKSLF